MANAHEIASRLSAEQRQALLRLGSDAEGDPITTELIDSLEQLGLVDYRPAEGQADLTALGRKVCGILGARE